MFRACNVVAAAAALWLVATGPARAFLPPSVRYMGTKQAQEQATKGYLNWDLLKERFRTTVGGLAVSLDYRYGTQDFLNTIPASPANMHPIEFASETELNSYLLRPEFVLSNWLSIYGIGALHEGTNRASGGSLDLDGWGAGVGANAVFGLPELQAASLGLPESHVPALKGVTIDPLFIAPDFNWTYNEFQDVNNGVETSNLTIRVGMGGRTVAYSWALYGGPMYQATTRDLVVKNPNRSQPGMPDTLSFQSEPENAWSGVVGATFGLRVAEHKRTLRSQLRPTLLATVEGGVGNRQGVLVSLRYEFDFLTRLLHDPPVAKTQP